MGPSILIIIILFSFLALIASAIALFVCRELLDAGFYAWLRNKLGVFGVVAGGLVTVALPFLCVGITVFILNVFGPILCVILFFLFIEAHRKYRASRQYALLWLLAVSAEREVPLTTAVDAFARERRGLFARRARRLAALLESGASLSEGLGKVPGLVPPHAVPMIRIGCETGALAPALRRAAEMNDRHGPAWTALIGKIAYVIILVVYAVFILTFVMGWIVPRFQKMFLDFDATMPYCTQVLISCSCFVVDYWFLFSPLYVILLFVPLFLLARYFGWDPPGMGRLARRLDAADALDALALVARRQRPMVDGLDVLARSHPRSYTRMLLGRAAGDARNGLGWDDALCSHGLIGRADLAVLRAAQRADNLPWALAEMAESYRRRFIYRLQALIQTAFPAFVILFGAMVGFVVVALFLPLIQLIMALA